MSSSSQGKDLTTQIEKLLDTYKDYRPFDYKQVKNVTELINLAYSKAIEAREKNSSVMLIANIAILMDVVSQARKAETYWMSRAKDQLLNVDITDEEIERFKKLHREYFELINIIRDFAPNRPVRFRGKFLPARKREKTINNLISKLSRTALDFSQRLAPLMKLQNTLYQRETILKSNRLTIKSFSESETPLSVKANDD